MSIPQQNGSVSTARRHEVSAISVRGRRGGQATKLVGARFRKVGEEEEQRNAEEECARGDGVSALARSLARHAAADTAADRDIASRLNG